MARDTLLGFPAHTLPYRRGKFITLSTASDTASCFMRRCFFDLARNRNKMALSEQGCPFLSAFHDFDSGIFPSRAQTIPEYGKKERWGCKSCCQFLFI